MRILVTGSAGFIGYHLSKALIKDKNNKVYGIDNLNAYYDVKLKKLRLLDLKSKNFKFIKIDIQKQKPLKKIFKKYKFDIVYHLAAQAGVRYSILNPKTYFDSNLTGFFNILEACRNNKVKHLIFASTSSVYGKQTKYPIKEQFNTDRPLSFYAATKKCNEVMAYAYNNIYNLKCTALRFFTVFGPMGRPDMALYKFANSLRKNKVVYLFNRGNHFRDFTYIDDVIYYLLKIKSDKTKKNYEIYNVCSNNPVSLKKYYFEIKKYFKKKPKVKKIELQKGDVVKTHGSNIKLKEKFGFKNFLNIELGIKNFVSWFMKN